MICQLLSDLHLEFGDLHFPISPGEEDIVLILAGDISTFEEGGYSRLGIFLRDVCERFRAVIYILGNHEYYGESLQSATEAFKDLPALLDLPNLHTLENESIRLDNISFIGGTLWSDFEEENFRSMDDCSRNLSDFYKIKGDIDKDIPLVEELLEAHYKTKNYISERLIEEDMEGFKTVVVTHYLPTYQSVHPKHLRSGLNGGFASDLDKEILCFNPNVWVHGHTHESFIYRLGRSMIYSNPRGYHGFEHNGLFNLTFRFEV